LPIHDLNDTNICAVKNTISGSTHFCEDPKLDKIELLLGLSRRLADNVNSDYEDFEKDAKNAAEFEIPGLFDVQNFLHFSTQSENSENLPFFSGIISQPNFDSLSELIAIQMQKIRHSDWRWFENFELNSILESQDVQRVSSTTWLDVLNIAFEDEFVWFGNGFQIEPLFDACPASDDSIKEIAWVIFYERLTFFELIIFVCRFNLQLKKYCNIVENMT